ncbi:MAG: hypothetical protein DSO07_10430 [Thermoproteota archaeon]|jgi:uncharacterized protein YdiU (UPF0061 family)|uniref:Uncharacterized protein n=1 Tax=Candidatus Methanodesulfokora washburnensis TaxID=2478471 RepID=A0A429GW62_9CREN|nr:hypothetical protein [Candidatus Methanodesulfokores washburnensis]RSN78062.1 hypothetical protein D6D85_01580 [Candidatus Methanodesulfokores washburnensis]RZN59121.1 MAG: hypothetical protein EF810_07020 [Candidatus Methanodesulfokores washburnensis]TDA39417.1 MAG: hypothetical protein DSO07_10430 [Candidatus Korarchaeota archaeon]
MEKRYLDVVQQEKGLLEKILTVFPGYRGYREKEVLRETDRLIRDTLFNDLRNAKAKLQNTYRPLALSNDPRAKEMEKLIMRLDSMAERIRHATYGYAPLMNVIQVNQKQILQLMSFDAMLAEKIEKIRKSIDDISQDPSKISEVDSCLTELEEVFSKRRDFMLGLGR